MVKLKSHETKIFSFLILSRLLIFIIARLTTISLGEFIARWDANHYLFLAQNGYVSSGIEKTYIVFPPFYPLLIKAFAILFINYEFSAILISNICFVIGGFVFYKLLRFDYSEKISLWIVIILSLFPTSYFFSAAYPESLFFLLMSLAFYFARQQKFRESSLIGGLAILTRPFGILVFSFIVIEWLLQKKKKDFLELILIISTMTAAGLVYLSLNYSLFGNFFAFGEILRTYWQKSFAFAWQGIIGSLRIGINTTTDLEFKYIVGYSEAIASIFSYVFILINLIFRKLRMRISYLIYFILAVIFMTSTSFVLSTPRYLLSIPPFFITLGLLTNYKTLKIVWIVISVLLLIYFTYLFTKGHWAF